jgi:hypothetical protein
VEVPLPGLAVVRPPLPLDYDGDGDDEMLFLYGDAGLQCAIAEYVSGEIVFGPAVSCGSSPLPFDTRHDFNADGRADVIVPLPSVFEELSLLTTSPAMELIASGSLDIVDEPASTGGGTFAVDPDGDGKLEFLKYAEPSGGDPGVQMRRESGGNWSTVGPVFEAPGCGTPCQAVWGDFNSDGHEDIILFDQATACDPAPVGYDPTWHRFLALITDPESGTMVSTGTFPIGEMPDNRAFADDLDGDGNVDLIFSTSGVAEPPVVFVRGNGDGTFDEGVPVFSAAAEIGSFVDYLQLDGDAPREFVFANNDGEYWILDAGADESTAVPFHERAPALRGFADANNDGISDYVRFELDADGNAIYSLMLSSP